MLKRSSISHINRILEKNSNWKILDVGCGFGAHKSASVIADIKDFSKLYKDKKFVLINDKKLPFKDKEFDFVIASHVIEHVEDFQFFIKELERITKKGYIELPTRLGDNLIFENKEYIEVPPTLPKQGNYVLRVSGDSMQDDGIIDGDYVVIKKINLAKPGDTVVAVVNGEATLKKYYNGKNGIELHPRNDQYSIIHISKEDELHIQGQVLGVFREYN